MGFTELERINLELDWFMELRDALFVGRIDEVTGSVDEAIRELRKLRTLLMEDLPIDSNADFDIAAGTMKGDRPIVSDADQDVALGRFEFVAAEAHKDQRLSDTCRLYFRSRLIFVESLKRESQ